VAGSRHADVHRLLSALTCMLAISFLVTGILRMFLHVLQRPVLAYGQFYLLAKIVSTLRFYAILIE